MSLLTFKASEAQRAMTNVIRNTNAIIFSFLKYVILIFYAAKLRLFAYTDKFYGLENQKNKHLVD